MFVERVIIRLGIWVTMILPCTVFTHSCEISNYGALE